MVHVVDGVRLVRKHQTIEPNCRQTSRGQKLLSRPSAVQETLVVVMFECPFIMSLGNKITEGLDIESSESRNVAIVLA